MKDHTKNAIECANCPMMEVTGRARYTSNNYHLSQPREDCFCKHPEAMPAFQLICPRSGRMPGFIAYTQKGTDKPNIKNAPRWCPRKLTTAPREISKADADSIIENRHPLGLFWLHDGEVYVGIDNSDGDAWAEDFSTKHKCLEWLMDKRCPNPDMQIPQKH